jgi:hypothetical protein
VQGKSSTIRRAGRLRKAATRRAVLLALASAAALALALPAAAAAAGPPQIGDIWMTEVSAGSATFNGELNPEGSSTTYRFEYTTDQDFQEKGFTGAAKAPAGGSAAAGSGSSFETVSKHVSALRAGTLYHYRLSATNTGVGGGTTTSPPQTFTTQEITGAFALPDSRGWELVSPAEKNGGAIQGFEANHGGGVLQASATGPGAITYSSSSSFGGSEATGAPQGNQYISRRSSTGWSTQNITTPVVSGSYGNDPNGVPYQLFSGDLAQAIMLNGVHCRGEGTGCPVANPPLPGSGAPDGYQDYYLRDNEDGSFTAVLTAANAELELEPEEFNLAFAGASPDLHHLILSTCAALTPTATEVPGIGGCDPSEPNLYAYSSGQLSLVNVNPGAELAGQGGAVSTDGSRVYFTEAGKLWLREGTAAPHELAAAAQFQTATPSGAFAFYTAGTAGEKLLRYSTATHTATELTPSGEVEGVLGASEDGSRVYYATAAGIFSWHGSISPVIATAGAATAGDYPPTTATARVSADGNRLLFLSTASLTGFDNTDAATGLPDSEVFLYSAAGSGSLSCVSCNPTGERPAGPSTIPGASSNGEEAAAAEGQIVSRAYKPRVLSATANRVFFDSEDSLAALDTNKASDVYQWEAQGTGSCNRAGGCQNLLSNGKDPEGASFIDASESGEDAYFLTSESLVKADPGSADVYDARVGGGFPEPVKPIPCEGDACVPLPAGPEDPTVGSLIPGVGDPPVHFPKVHHKCPTGKRSVIRHGKSTCVAKHHKSKHNKRGNR